MNEFDNTIKKLEEELSLPAGFFDGLKNEDDWSFVIKCHALIETACSFLLTTYFRNPNFKDLFARIEMSDIKKGKIVFLKKADLMIPEEINFITGLSELRNKLAHDIQGIAFKFTDYLVKLDKNQKKSFAKRFGYAYLKSDSEGKLVLSDPKPIIENPKVAIYKGVKVIMAIIMLQVESCQLKDKTDKLIISKKEIYKLILANQ
jgi:hypothetical protein